MEKDHSGATHHHLLSHLFRSLFGSLDYFDSFDIFLRVFGRSCLFLYKFHWTSKHLLLCHLAYLYAGWSHSRSDSGFLLRMLHSIKRAEENRLYAENFVVFRRSRDLSTRLRYILGNGIMIFLTISKYLYQTNYYDKKCVHKLYHSIILFVRLVLLFSKLCICFVFLLLICI